MTCDRLLCGIVNESKPLSEIIKRCRDKCGKNKQFFVTSFLDYKWIKCSKRDEENVRFGIFIDFLVK